MRFVHLSDLHIGRRLHELDLLPDQIAALDAVLALVEKAKPDVALIAGDVYDKAVPSAAAVTALDAFLTALSAMTRVFIIAGNHDSRERLSFGSRLFAARGLHISGVYDGSLSRVTVPDRWGEVDITLMPFFKPREVAPFFEEPLLTSDAAVRAVLAREKIDFSRRSILLAHHFVVSSGETVLQSDSENAVGFVGGVECVDASAFDGFNYVALGHLHAPQSVGRPEVRYAGSPLKYSFSECRHVKSMVVGEINGDGAVSFELVPIPFLHDLREIKGPLDALVSDEIVQQANPSDYLSVTLTDAILPVNPRGRLESVYPNVLEMALDRGVGSIVDENVRARVAATPMARFEAFYAMMNGKPLGENAAARVLEALERAAEAEA